ncbi:hypothetical protein TRFO_35947 [Tritrichomonas foetus]|uniref:Uncharacterized protein n=1 Tax=Tritrichomonas foetus TaxID=1144522 RepID=A0A1J4JHL8_9EUKA|nr:hypothetical protein TRFO_35947 [Tritrichomonas foetus]|eukprot:OHS97743.1 hypothetical protein TRFO_35947 [Tritrichomonas foetus]
MLHSPSHPKIIKSDPEHDFNQNAFLKSQTTNAHQQNNNIDINDRNKPKKRLRNNNIALFEVHKKKRTFRANKYLIRHQQQNVIQGKCSGGEIVVKHGNISKPHLNKARNNENMSSSQDIVLFKSNNLDCISPENSIIHANKRGRICTIGDVVRMEHKYFAHSGMMSMNLTINIIKDSQIIQQLVYRGVEPKFSEKSKGYHLPLAGKYGKHILPSKHSMILKDEDTNDIIIIRKAMKDMFEVECNDNLDPLLVSVIAITAIEGVPSYICQ